MYVITFCAQVAWLKQSSALEMYLIHTVLYIDLMCSWYIAVAKVPTIEDVIYSLTGFKDWGNLAFHLDLPPAMIVDILRSSSTEPLREVIEYWFQTANPTWSKLVSALELCAYGGHHTAEPDGGTYVKCACACMLD